MSRRFDELRAKSAAQTQRLGAERFDFLVNNAGTAHHNASRRRPRRSSTALYNVHLKGVFFLTQKLLPLINDGGRIVNLSSGLTRIVDPGQRALCVDERRGRNADGIYGQGIGPRRIAVNFVAPGAIETDFSGGMVRTIRRPTNTSRV